ncbi:MAG: hypothetical protein LWX83_18310, partial [Anaerolineae bacterium]|nr:hypothetical protein [Anaerolineae bacterium]
MNILFVVVCIPFFPSGIVRVERYFNLLHEAGIQYRWINFNSPRVQRWLEWLDTSWFGRKKIIDFIFRSLIHASGFPHQWIYMFKILVWSKKYDVVYFQSVLTPTWYIHLLSLLNQRIVFDFDDALYIRRQKQTQKMIQSSWKVMAGSQVLVNFARQYNPSAIFMPGSVTIKHYDSNTMDDISEHKPLCIGWVGGASMLKQLEILVEPITRLVEKGYSLNILIAGSKKNSQPLNRVKGINIIDIPDYVDNEIPELIKQIDIGVMPLYDYP